MTLNVKLLDPSGYVETEPGMRQHATNYTAQDLLNQDLTGKIIIQRPLTKEEYVTGQRYGSAATTYLFKLTDTEINKDESGSDFIGEL